MNLKLLIGLSVVAIVLVSGWFVVNIFSEKIVYKPSEAIKNGNDLLGKIILVGGEIIGIPSHCGMEMVDKGLCYVQILLIDQPNPFLVYIQEFSISNDNSLYLNGTIDGKEVGCKYINRTISCLPPEGRYIILQGILAGGEYGVYEFVVNKQIR